MSSIDMAAKKPAHGSKAHEPSRKRGRVQVNILLSDKVKDRLVAAATASGRTVSAEVEFWITTAMNYDAMLKAMRSGFVPLVEEGELDAALQTAVGGFEPWQPGELEASLETTARARKAAGITDEQVEAANAEAIRRSNLGATFNFKPSQDQIAEIEQLLAEGGAAIESKKDDAA